MKVSRVLETCLYVEDLEAAESFYTTVLGLTRSAKVKDRHVFFRCGQGMLLLFDPESTAVDSGEGIPAHGTAGAGHVAFHMAPSEIDAWREHLLSHEVEIEIEYTWPSGGFSLYFRDPSQNSLELVTPQTWGIDDAAPE